MAFDNTHLKTISCRIPANVKARLDAICGENCKTMGELMRDMIRTTYPDPIFTTTEATIPTTKEATIKTTTGTTIPATKPTTKGTTIPVTKEATIKTATEWDDPNTCEGCGKHFTGTEKEVADSYNKHVRNRMTNSKHPKIQAKYRKIFGNLY